MDLKQRGLLDDTLVVWGGEFGRTVYSQGTLTRENYGRDHHPRNFCMWLAGGGIKGGIVHGETDDFSYNIAENPCHVLDLYATMLQLPGHRSRTLQLPLPGARSEADGRRGGAGDSGVDGVMAADAQLTVLTAQWRARRPLLPASAARCDMWSQNLKTILDK